MKNSTFLRGSNDRGWTASFDWNNFFKILEGRYDNAAAPETSFNLGAYSSFGMEDIEKNIMRTNRCVF